MKTLLRKLIVSLQSQHEKDTNFSLHITIGLILVYPIVTATHIIFYRWLELDLTLSRVIGLFVTFLICWMFERFQKSEMNGRNTWKDSAKDITSGCLPTALFIVPITNLLMS